MQDSEITDDITLVQFLQVVLASVVNPTPPQPCAWSELETYNCEEENVLHLIARQANADKLLAVLQKQLALDTIRTLVSAGNANSETPFHYACKYCNLHLFNFIAKHVDTKMLFAMANSTNTSIGRTPFLLLCEAAYQEPSEALENGWLAMEHFPLEGDRAKIAYQPAAINNTEPHRAVMARFAEVFAEEDLDSLITQKDWFGNDGLMLCCYSSDPSFIASCLRLFKNKDKLAAALQSPLRETQLSPIRFLSALSTPECIQLLVPCFEDKNAAAEIFFKQHALDWCYGWSKSPELRYAVACAYGDRLEEAIITRGERRSLLCQSLHGDGAIVRRLMEKKHIKLRYKIICEVLFSLYGKESAASPRHSPRLFAQNGLGAHREVLAKILRIHWPLSLLQSLGNAIMTEFATPDKIQENCKARLMSIIITHSTEFLSIPLALTYQLSEEKLSLTMVINKEKLKPQEAEYVNSFQTDRAMLENFRKFYQDLISQSEGNKLAKAFLTRVHKSRSLLLLTLFDTLNITDHLDRIITERFVAALEKVLAEPLPIKKVQ